MNNLLDSEANQNADEEVMSLLWKDREHCVVRSMCGVADAMGVTIKPDLVRRLLNIYDRRWTKRYEKLQKHGIYKFRFNIDHTLSDVMKLIGEINRGNYKNIPFPQMVFSNSLDEAFQLTTRGELAIFMDPFPGHNIYHVVHVGSKSNFVNNNGIECIQDKYEAFQIPLLNQAFQHKVTHVALFANR